MKTRILGGIASLVMTLSLTQAAHAVGPITSVALSPTSADVKAGLTATLTLSGRDADGATADETANARFSTTDPLGNMNGNVYTAGKAGTWTVTGTYNGLTAEATVMVTPGALHDLVVNPDSNPEFVTAGEKQQFTATGFDAFNNRLSDISVTWSITGDIGSVDTKKSESTTFIASQPGSGKLTATSGSISQSVALTVDAARATTAANANLNAGTTAVPLTNQSVNTNTSSDVGTNVNAPAVTETKEESTTDDQCKGWSRSAWIWLFLAYAAATFSGLWLIRSPRRSWWWAIPLFLTIVSLWLYFQYRCYPVYPGLPYLTILTGIAAATWYNARSTSAPRP